jgi:hypothetical protein
MPHNCAGMRRVHHLETMLASRNEQRTMKKLKTTLSSDRAPAASAF